MSLGEERRTGQTDLCADWGMENSLPEWVRGYDDPVVRGTGYHSKTMHKPDFASVEPARACGVGSDPDGWIVMEARDLADFYSACRCDECRDYLEGLK